MTHAIQRTVFLASRVEPKVDFQEALSKTLTYPGQLARKTSGKSSAELLCAGDKPVGNRRSGRASTALPLGLSE